MDQARDIFRILSYFKKNMGNYPSQIQSDIQNNTQPFFNNSGNNPIQWAGKVITDTRQRGPFEGMQDLTNPAIQNPVVYPMVEPIISNIRMANFQAGRPNPFINALLGQTDAQYGIRSRKSLFNWGGY